MCKLNNILQHSSDQNRIQKGVKNILIQMKMETQHNQNNGLQQKTVPRRWFIAINAYIRKKRKISNNLTLSLKELEKEQTKPKVTKRGALIKIRAEINEMETKWTIENEEKLKLRLGFLKS